MKTSLFLIPALMTGFASASELVVSGSIENTLWAGNDVPAAFLEFDDEVFHDPRASLSFDYQPDPRIFFHATLRADRGFDPGTQTDGDIRLDALILRYRPFGDNSLNLQAGKFPTVIGNWVPTHGYYEDPFLLAPLPYSAITGINVLNATEHSPQTIANRAQAARPNIHLAKTNWSSIVWGPAYSNGFAVFGNRGKIDYALEMKNTFAGSSPEEWDLGEGDFSHPTISGRIGYQHDASLSLGLSASHGPYLNAGSPSRGDFHQTLMAADIRWAHRDWILSAEMFFATYDSLGEDLEMLSYYLQARYKVLPGFWIAARLGQTVSNDVSTPFSPNTEWTANITRAEIALGWRISPDLLLKTQYTHTDVTNEFSAPQEDLFGISFGLKF